MLSHLRHHYLYYNHHNPLITIITITAMSLSQPFVNSEQDCMILAATTTCFPLRRKNKLRVIQVANISYPNFKPSNPKSHTAWFVSPRWFRSFIPPFRPNQQKNPLKNRRKNSVFFAEFFPEVRLPRVIVPACAGAYWIAWTGPAPGEFGGSAMMDWVEGQWWRGGSNDQGKKGGMGEKSWGMMMDFQSGFARDI